MITVGVGLLGTLAVAVAPPLAPPLFRIAGVAIRIADQMVSWLAALPAASVHVVTPSLLELALLYGGLAACLLRGRLRLWLLSGCVLGLVTDARAWALARQAPDTLRITFISVGQGDAALVELPGGRVLVVDGGGLGGRFDVGARVVAPQLWRRKIARADWLALSHADFDHFGGLAFLVEAFAPQALWWNGVPGHGERFAELRDAATAHAVRWREPAGRTWNVNGVILRAFEPWAALGGGDNDRSLVLQLRYGGRAVLFTGDLERGGESALVAQWGATLASDILKVPHHGSRTSSSAALLAAVAPRDAVISCGAGNRFGFPHPSVVAAYAQRGTTLWRTDRDGAVTMVIRADGALHIDSARSAAARDASRGP